MTNRPFKVVALGGDGIGPEVTREGVRVLEAVAPAAGLDLEVEWALVGGAAVEAGQAPVEDSVMEACQASDAVLLGAVGDPKYNHLPPAERPERALLTLRAGLGLWLNLRPASLLPPLAASSPLREERTAGTDMLVVRELRGGLYFSGPRGIETDADGKRSAINTMAYDEHEIERCVRAAFELARKRRKHVTSVDKSNVLEVSMLWRTVVNEVAQDYPDIELEHGLVDSTALRLITHPASFDVIVTENTFGDIVSDVAAGVGGSLGLLPSASLGDGKTVLYEPVHGSAPDIAGQGIANPIAMILSVAMLLEHSAQNPAAARAVEEAVNEVLASGLVTPDLASDGRRTVGTEEFGKAVAEKAAAKLGVEA